MWSTWGTRRRSASMVLLAIAGCAREPLPLDDACEAWLRGGLVITEIHANPDGSDGQREYIELYNPGDAAVTMEGLSLVASRSDGTGAEEHRVGAQSVGAGEYIVFGNAAPDGLPPHVDVGYGGALGSLRNSNGAIEVRCGELVIDRVEYDRTTDGRALARDGAQRPGEEGDDEVWCVPESAEEFAVGDHGSPGAANDSCTEDPEAETCSDGAARRPAARLGPGEATLVEWMPNPNGPDGELEWVEVLVSVAADLHGLRLGTTDEELGRPITEDECFPVDAGTRVVFGASPTAAPRVDADLPLSLGNTGDRGLVLSVDGIAIDRVDYSGSTEGVSWQRDANGEICLTDSSPDSEYASSNYGTPGEANAECALVLEHGWCLAPSGPRRIVQPLPQHVAITEWMASPVAGGSRDGEWVEVLFTEDADLNGVLWSDRSGSGSPVESDSCVEVAAGTHLVFARSLDTEENGGLDLVDGSLDVSLNNGDETIAISVDGVELDAVEYDRAVPGVATQVDEAGGRCEARSAYGEGDLGTPGAPNPWCD